MTSKTDALLADVLAHPTDDEPRLVLADRLAEQGDPRGEFISLQVALARPIVGASRYIHRHRGKEVSATEQELVTRVKKLLKKHQKEWLAPIRPFIRTWIWRRGFVDCFEADAAKFLGGMDVIAAHTPIARVKLTALKPPSLAALCKRPELETMEGLDLHEQRLGPKEAPALGGAPLVMLEHLDLWGNPLGDDGLAAIFASKHLTRLKRLQLYKCGLTQRSFATLARSPCFATLERLDLSEMDGLDADLLSLLEQAPNLRELKLGNAILTDEHLERLAAVPTLNKLEWINLPRPSWHITLRDPTVRNLHSERGVKALLAAPGFGALRRINGLFEEDDVGPLGTQSKLAADFRARFGAAAV